MLLDGSWCPCLLICSFIIRRSPIAIFCHGHTFQVLYICKRFIRHCSIIDRIANRPSGNGTSSGGDGGSDSIMEPFILHYVFINTLCMGSLSCIVTGTIRIIDRMRWNFSRWWSVHLIPSIWLISCMIQLAHHVLRLETSVRWYHIRWCHDTHTQQCHIKTMPIRARPVDNPHTCITCERFFVVSLLSSPLAVHNYDDIHG